MTRIAPAVAALLLVAAIGAAARATARVAPAEAEPGGATRSAEDLLERLTSAERLVWRKAYQEIEGGETPDTPSVRTAVVQSLAGAPGARIECALTTIETMGARIRSPLAVALEEGALEGVAVPRGRAARALARQGRAGLRRIERHIEEAGADPDILAAVATDAEPVEALRLLCGITETAEHRTEALIALNTLARRTCLDPEDVERVSRRLEGPVSGAVRAICLGLDPDAGREDLVAWLRSGDEAAVEAALVVTAAGARFDPAISAAIALHVAGPAGPVAASAFRALTSTSPLVIEALPAIVAPAPLDMARHMEEDSVRALAICVEALERARDGVVPPMRDGVLRIPARAAWTPAPDWIERVAGALEGTGAHAFVRFELGHPDPSRLTWLPGAIDAAERAMASEHAPTRRWASEFLVAWNHGTPEVAAYALQRLETTRRRAPEHILMLLYLRSNAHLVAGRERTLAPPERWLSSARLRVLVAAGTESALDAAVDALTSGHTRWTGDHFLALIGAELTDEQSARIDAFAAEAFARGGVIFAPYVLAQGAGGLNAIRFALEHEALDTRMIGTMLADRLGATAAPLIPYLEAMEETDPVAIKMVERVARNLRLR